MHYRMSGANGQVIEEGDGSVDVANNVVTVAPQLGQPLRIEPAQITEVSEPAPFVVRIRLSDGSAVDLSQLGQIRTQLLSQIGDVRVADTRSSLVTIGIGKPERFHGAVNDVEADILLYDDGMVAIPVSGIPVQAPYAVIENASTDPSGYRISVDVGDGETIVVQRLAQMTSQFLDELRKRVSDSRGRTASFLAALLPGLGPMAQRSAANALRDGVAAPKTDLDSIDQTIWPVLLQAVALPYRRETADVLGSLGETALGFHQRESVEVAASGAVSVQTPKDNDLSGPGTGSAGRPMLQRGMEMMTAQAMTGQGRFAGQSAAGPMGSGFGAPFGMMGGLLAMRMLRGDSAWAEGGQQQAQTMFKVPEAPPATTGGGATPARTDIDTLTAGGDAPTIRAFLITRTSNGRLLYETLNEEDHGTYVFNAPELTMHAFNRMLLLLGFHIEVIGGVTGTIDGAGAKYSEAIKQLPYLNRLAGAFVANVWHVEDHDAWKQALLKAIG
ncbi:MAG: hypothetical protein JOY80_02455 [Candidatus Dormibacteraeota bacterium]|nr:hypothetical protein [Candidatus Dormibacteraeota bacterium]